MRAIVEGSTPILHDWNKFLVYSENKVQLFRFLSKAVIEAASHLTNVVVYSTYDDHILVNTCHNQSIVDLATIMPCNHQEADRMVFLHLSHTAQAHTKAYIRTIDSDIDIITVSHFFQPMVACVMDRLRNCKGLSAHPSSRSHQKTWSCEKALTLPLFLSYTG